MRRCSRAKFPSARQAAANAAAWAPGQLTLGNLPPLVKVCRDCGRAAVGSGQTCGQRAEIAMRLFLAILALICCPARPGLRSQGSEIFAPELATRADSSREMKYYPHLASKANLGPAHWRLMAPGAARKGRTGTNAHAQCIRARQVHKSITQNLPPVRMPKHAATSDKVSSKKISWKIAEIDEQHSQSRIVCCQISGRLGRHRRGHFLWWPLLRLYPRKVALACIHVSFACRRPLGYHVVI